MPSWNNSAGGTSRRRALWRSWRDRAVGMRSARPWITTRGCNAFAARSWRCATTRGASVRARRKRGTRGSQRWPRMGRPFTGSAPRSSRCWTGRGRRGSRPRWNGNKTARWPSAAWSPWWRCGLKRRGRRTWLRRGLGCAKSCGDARLSRSCRLRHRKRASQCLGMCGSRMARRCVRQCAIRRIISGERQSLRWGARRARLHPRDRARPSRGGGQGHRGWPDRLRLHPGCGTGRMGVGMMWMAAPRAQLMATPADA